MNLILGYAWLLCTLATAVCLLLQWGAWDDDKWFDRFTFLGLGLVFLSGVLLFAWAFTLPVTPSI